MRNRWKPPLPIVEILNKALEKWNIATTLKKYELMDHWDQVVGEKTASKSRPTKFQGENLIVEVDHPTWVQELNLLKPQILKKIYQTHPKTGIKNIRFVLKG